MFRDVTAVLIGSQLPTFRTTYRPLLQGSSNTRRILLGLLDPWKVGRIVSPKTSATMSHIRMRNIPEERKSHVLEVM